MLGDNGKSLKSRVLEALRANNELATRKDNAELYALVGAETTSQKTSVRVFKKKFNDGDYDWTGKPDGLQPRRPEQPRDKPPAPDVQASVFRVSGKGDLRDKVTEYFRENPHMLEERSNLELYATVGADDSTKQNTARSVKSQLKKAVRESGLGVVVIEVKKDSIEAMKELERELETLEVRLTPRQMKATEIFHSGTTQIDAVMQAYGVSYEQANGNASNLFNKHEGVKCYLRHLRDRDAAESVRHRRELRQERLERSRAANMEHFAEWDTKKGRPRLKKIVPQWTLKGMKSMKTMAKYADNALIEDSTSFTLHDAEKIQRSLEDDLAKPLHNGSANSSDLEIHDLWERFIKKDAEDSLSAIDFAHELASRGYPVPESVKMQASYELASMEPPPPPPPGGGDIIDPQNFSHENLNKEKERVLGKYKEYYQRQLEDFLPKREREIHEIAAEHGFDREEKPRDIILSHDDKVEPPAHKPEDDEFDLSGRE